MNQILNRKYKPAELFVLIYAALSLIFLFQLGLTEQEAYYWMWSKNLDWGYFDHPPLQAWVTALLSFLFGDNKWVIRLPAFFGSFATMILFYKWIQSKWNDSAAQFACLYLFSTHVFMFGSVIAIPDSFAVPLGLAAIIYTERGHLAKASFFLGLALLAKWTVFLIVPGVLYHFYKQKKLNLKNLLQLSFLPVLFQLPVIWWNIQHSGVSFKFHLYDRHVHEIRPLLTYFKNFIQFFLNQIFAIGLVTFFSILFLIFIKIKKTKIKLENLDWASVAAWTLPGLIVVLISALQGEIRYYWTFLNWLPAIAAISYLTALHFKNQLQYIKFAAVVLIFTTWAFAGIVGFLPVGHSVETVLNLNPDLRHSPVGEIFGWKQWVDKDLIPNHLIDEQTAYIGSDLHVASRLAWSLRKYNHLNLIGVNSPHKNQFQFWPQPEPPQFKKAIFFADNRYNQMASFQNLCGHLLTWTTSEIKISGETVKEIYWSPCQDYKTSHSLN